MQLSEELDITQADVPYVGHSWFMWLMLTTICVTWIVGCIIGEFRPGIIEFLIGLLLAYFPSRVFARAWIDYMRRVAVAAKEVPWLKWLPLLPASSVVRYEAIRFAVALGVVLSAIAVYGLAATVPDVPAPWARWAGVDMERSAPYVSMGIAMVAYVTFVTLVMIMQTLRWYDRLPLGNSGSRS